ncbi:MAG: hypothetical protein ACR2QF_12150 [Geminicoccaceae bacterium]
MADVNNMQDIIDSRDVIECIEELEDTLSSSSDHVKLLELYDRGTDDLTETERDRFEFMLEEIKPYDVDDINEASEQLKPLKALADETSNYAEDWDHGAALIRDSYFEQYAEQLADDIGAVNSNASWPNNHIDWESAANELKIDYTAVEFDGVTYWVR